MTTTIIIIGFVVILITIIVSFIMLYDKYINLSNSLQRFKESKDFTSHYIQMHDELISKLFDELHKTNQKISSLAKYLSINYDYKSCKYYKGENPNALTYTIKVDTKEFEKQLKKAKKMANQYLGEEQTGTIYKEDVEKNNPKVNIYRLLEDFDTLIIENRGILSNDARKKWSDLYEVLSVDYKEPKYHSDVLK